MYKKLLSSSLAVLSVVSVPLAHAAILLAEDFEIGPGEVEFENLSSQQ